MTKTIVDTTKMNTIKIADLSAVTDLESVGLDYVVLLRERDTRRIVPSVYTGLSEDTHEFITPRADGLINLLYIPSRDISIVNSIVEYDEHRRQKVNPSERQRVVLKKSGALRLFYGLGGIQQ